VSGKACRLAPVAIDELNLSELYVARPAFSIVLGSVSRTKSYPGYILVARQRTDNWPDRSKRLPLVPAFR
jgi:hypothetical protein